MMGGCTHVYGVECDNCRDRAARELHGQQLQPYQPSPQWPYGARPQPPAQIPQLPPQPMFWPKAPDLYEEILAEVRAIRELLDRLEDRPETVTQQEEIAMVRCKFSCASKREYRGWDGSGKPLYEYEFNAVTSGSEENKAFFAATPTGQLKVSSVSDGQFEVGKEYYLDISAASAEQRAA